MTREEAINALRCLITMPGFTANEALDMAIAALREQSKVVESDQFKWISVKDRLPKDKKDEYVLVVCEYHGKISVETRKKWNLDSSVSHWIPLPEPPKGE